MYDAIVIGARCAGAPTARLLAQKGHRVLLVDKSQFPSGKRLSTHTVFTPGVAALDRMGLLERIEAANTPRNEAVEMDFGPFKVVTSPPPQDGITWLNGPRRHVLDNALVEGAVEAGVELRDRFEVTEVSIEDGRVVGIRGRDVKSGTEVTEKAKIVIGADGINSLVARTVNAPKYRETPTRSGIVFSYWSGVPLDNVVIYFRPDRLFAAQTTNDGLTTVMEYVPIDAYHEFCEDIDQNFMGDWKQHVPDFHERLMEGKREERWIGTGYQPNYFRKPGGPGWALAGDAEIHHDSNNPSGISYSLINGEYLAQAIHAGLSGDKPMEQALDEYEKRRNDRWSAHYDFVVAGAGLEPPPPEAQELIGLMPDKPKLASHFLGFVEGCEDCLDFFDPDNIQALLAS
ncbi:MAG: NAD(P)/FAD-dependent oxidoreductase [Proteobacteria bacterium]|nr:NAD(P)/FAD-dependent oxidoreductase [Pseudomonadota bacterium]